MLLLTKEKEEKKVKKVRNSMKKYGRPAECFLEIE
jgi:hypothetical protein